jgi:hypothetical protein
MEDSHSVVLDGYFDRMFCCSYTDHQLDVEDSSIISYGVASDEEKQHERSSSRLSPPRKTLARRHTPDGSTCSRSSSSSSSSSRSNDQYSRSIGDMTTAFGMERYFPMRQQQHEDHIDAVVGFDPREPLPSSSSSMSHNQMELYHPGTLVSSSIISASVSQRSIGTDTTAPCSSHGSCEVTSSSSTSSSGSSTATATSESNNSVISTTTTSDDDEDTALRDSSLTFGSTSSASFSTREAFDPSQNKHDNPCHYTENDIRKNNSRKKQGTTRVGMSTAAALEDAKARSRLLRETRDAVQQQKRSCHKNNVCRDRSSSNSNRYKCKVGQKEKNESSRYKKNQQPPGTLLVPPHDIRRIQSESLSELRLLSQTESRRC